jgi:uncharacterized protein DUF2510
MIPVSFKHFTACPNCKRIDPVSKAQIESAQAHQASMRAAGPDAAGIAPHVPTLEGAVNEWASAGQPQGLSDHVQAAAPTVAAALSDPVPPPPVAPAGWFPDPSGTGTQRYWDGRQWTEHTAPLA